MSRSQSVHKPFSREEIESALYSWITNNVAVLSKEELIKTLHVLRKELIAVREKGGYTMVSEGGSDITIYQNR